MKYCLKWNNLCVHLKDADEISIKYIEDKGLLDFMKKYADKRIILRLESADFGEGEIAKLVAIHRHFPEYRFTVGIPGKNLALAGRLKESYIPFYFLDPVQDWETLHYYITELQVSDIDISGPLGFELDKVKQIVDHCVEKPVVRATPNIVRAGTSQCPPLKMFFIRPDDIDVYEDYIDVIEFEGIEHQDTFFNIYAKKKTFIGNLNQVIYNFPLPIDNLGLITLFGESRVRCGRKCLFSNRCKRCDTLASISEKKGPEIREKIKEKILSQVNNNETN